MGKPNLSIVEEPPKLKPLAQKRPAVVAKVKMCEAQSHKIRKIYQCCLCDLCKHHICAALCLSMFVQLFVYVSIIYFTITCVVK